LKLLTQDKDQELPDCLKEVLDSLCGVQKMVDVELQLEEALKSKNIHSKDTESQRLLTENALAKWEGDQSNKLAFLDFQREKEILNVLNDRDSGVKSDLINSIDTTSFNEYIDCLDSISSIFFRAVELTVKENSDVLNSKEKQEIVRNSKLCAQMYGDGVHLMRALASTFDNTDYRKYDLECEELASTEYLFDENQKLFQRHERNKHNFRISPNPNSGHFNIQLSSNKVFKNIRVLNLLGEVIYSSNDLSEQIDLNHVAKGVYYVQVTYLDTTFEVEPLTIQ